MLAGCCARMPKTVYVLNGPNLNLLGSREPEIYGRATLADVEKLCRATAKQHSLAIEFRQSNHEGEIIDWIHGARGKAAGIIINAGGYSHTSIAIMDALVALKIDLDCDPHIPGETLVLSGKPGALAMAIDKLQKG